MNKGNNGNGGQSATIDDGLLAWTDLSAAGFLNSRFTLTSGAVTTPDDSNSPKNPYGAYLQILFDNSWSYSTNSALRHNMKTANLIPVAILAAIARKIDDGRPGSGRFQFSTALLGPTPDTYPGYSPQAIPRLSMSRDRWLYPDSAASPC